MRLDQLFIHYSNFKPLSSKDLAVDRPFSTNSECYSNS